LKPACEPIVLARKPISEKNVAQNVLKWGIGGLNIDGCRISVSKSDRVVIHSNPKLYSFSLNKSELDYRENNKGRFPANVILDEEASKMLDEQSGILKSGELKSDCYMKNRDNKSIFAGAGKFKHKGYEVNSGGASRFFYVAKASKNERWGYCHFCDKPIKAIDADKHIHDAIEKYRNTDKYHYLEFHPTVKPLKLMNYLIKLVTPKDATLLDPFMGTGTTLVECKKLGINAIGIDLSEVNCKIAKQRILNTPNRLDTYL